MATPRVPRIRWTLDRVCPSCTRSAAVTLSLTGGRMPATGARALHAQCAGCGHTWELPASGARAAKARRDRRRG